MTRTKTFNFNSFQYAIVKLNSIERVIHNYILPHHLKNLSIPFVSLFVFDLYRQGDPFLLFLFLACLTLPAPVISRQMNHVGDYTDVIGHFPPFSNIAVLIFENQLLFPTIDAHLSVLQL
jgi:hypothetical protein